MVHQFKSITKIQANFLKTFTYYLNSSLSRAITLFHHGVTTVVPPVALFPVGTPNTLEKKRHLKIKME